MIKYFYFFCLFHWVYPSSLLSYQWHKHLYVLKGTGDFLLILAITIPPLFGSAFSSSSVHQSDHSSQFYLLSTILFLTNFERKCPNHRTTNRPILAWVRTSIQCLGLALSNSLLRTTRSWSMSILKRSADLTTSIRTTRVTPVCPEEAFADLPSKLGVLRWNQSLFVLCKLIVCYYLAVMGKSIHF